MIAFALKPFQCRLVADQRADDIAVHCCLLPPDDHQIAFENAVLDHAVAFDLEGEGFFAASKLARHRHKSFDVFFRQYRHTGSDTANDGNLFRFGERGTSRLADNFDGPFPDPLDIALLFEGL